MIKYYVVKYKKELLACQDKVPLRALPGKKTWCGDARVIGRGLVECEDKRYLLGNTDNPVIKFMVGIQDAGNAANPGKKDPAGGRHQAGILNECLPWLTIMLICGIIYCTTTNPVSGDDNVITGTEKYEYTYTHSGVLINSQTRTVTGEIEHHYAVDIKDYDNKGRLCLTISALSDGSSTMTGYDTTGAVVYVSQSKRVY